MMENLIEHFYQHWSLDSGVSLFVNVEVAENCLVDHIIDQLVSKLHFQIVQRSISNAQYYSNRWHYKLTNRQFENEISIPEDSQEFLYRKNNLLPRSKSFKLVSNALRFEQNYIKGANSRTATKPLQSFKFKQKANSIHKSITAPSLYITSTDLLNFTNNYLIANSNYLAYQLDNTDYNYKDFDAVYLQIKSLDLIRNLQPEQNSISTLQLETITSTQVNWSKIESKIVELLNTNQELLIEAFSNFFQNLETNSSIVTSSITSKSPSITFSNFERKNTGIASNKFTFSNGSFDVNEDYLKDLNSLNLLNNSHEFDNVQFDTAKLESVDFEIAYNEAKRYLQIKFREISSSFYLESVVKNINFFDEYQEFSNQSGLRESIDITHNFWFRFLFKSDKLQQILGISNEEMDVLKKLSVRNASEFSRAGIKYHPHGISLLANNFADDFCFWGYEFFGLLRKYLLTTLMQYRGEELLNKTLQVAVRYTQVVHSLYTQLNDALYLQSIKSQDQSSHQILKINLYKLAQYLNLKGSEIVDELKLNNINCYLIRIHSNQQTQQSTKEYKHLKHEQIQELCQNYYLDSKYIQLLKNNKLSVKDLFEYKLILSCSLIYKGIILNHSYTNTHSSVKPTWKFTYFPFAHNVSLG